jgi:hypothetical protein
LLIRQLPSHVPKAAIPNFCSTQDFGNERTTPTFRTSHACNCICLQDSIPRPFTKTAVMALCSTAAWRPWRGSENDRKVTWSNVQRFKRSSDTAVDSAVLFVSLAALSFKRNFLESLSHSQTSLAKPGHIADVDLINKRRRWA